MPEHPSDKAVLTINNAVRNLRYLFDGEYGFFWNEIADEQVFEINVAYGVIYPPNMPGDEPMSRVSTERFTFTFAEAETMTAEEMSGAVFAKLSSAESEGFGE